MDKTELERLIKEWLAIRDSARSKSLKKLAEGYARRLSRFWVLL